MASRDPFDTIWSQATAPEQGPGDGFDALWEQVQPSPKRQARPSSFGRITPEERAESGRTRSELLRTVQGFDANFAQGMFLPGFADETRAAIRNPLSFAQHLIPGGKSGEEYVQARDEERATVAQYRKERPVGAVAANIAGGIATARYLPAMAGAAKAAVSRIPGVGATVARAIPAFQTGAAAPVTLGKLAHEGAALGAVAGAGEAKEMGDVPGAATVGGAFGLGAGILTRAGMGAGSWGLDKAGLRGKFAETLNGWAGRMGQAKPKGTPEEVAEAVRGVQYRTTAGGSPTSGQPGTGVLSALDDRAREMLLVDAERAGLTVDDIEKAALQAAASGKPITVQEILGQPAMRRARNVRAIPSEGSRIVEEVNEFRVTDREGGALPRVRGDLAKRFGVEPEDASLTAEQLIARRKRNAKPAYAPLDDAPPVRDPETLALLDDPAFQSAYEVAARVARRDGIDAPDLATARKEGIPARVFDNMKQAMDDVVGRGVAKDTFVGRNEGRQLGGMMSDALTRADEEIVDAAGNRVYKAARQQYAGDSAAMNAFEQGAEDYASTKVTAAQMARKMEAMDDTSRELYRRSIFNAANLDAGAVGRGNDLTRKMSIPNTEEKLRVAMGEEAFEQWLKDLEAEASIYATRRFTNQGSQTYDKSLDNEDFTEQAVGVGGDLVKQDWLALVKRVAGRAGPLAQGVNRQTADALAPMLTAGGRATKETLAAGGLSNKDELLALVKALREAGAKVAKRRGAKENVRRGLSGAAGMFGGGS